MICLVAKLSHSIVGCYDHILAGRYSLTRNGTHDFRLALRPANIMLVPKKNFLNFSVHGVRADSMSVRAVTAGLFLSMLPLHADRPDRQIAFIANALRLYAEIERC